MTDPLNRPNMISALAQEAWWLQPTSTHALMGHAGHDLLPMTVALAANIAERCKTSVPRELHQLLNAAEDPITKAHIRECIAGIGAGDITIDLKDFGIETPGVTL